MIYRRVTTPEWAAFEDTTWQRLREWIACEIETEMGLVKVRRIPEPDWVFLCLTDPAVQDPWSAPELGWGQREGTPQAHVFADRVLDEFDVRCQHNLLTMPCEIDTDRETHTFWITPDEWQWMCEQWPELIDIADVSEH